MENPEQLMGRLFQLKGAKEQYVVSRAWDDNGTIKVSLSAHNHTSRFTIPAIEINAFLMQYVEIKNS